MRNSLQVPQQFFKEYLGFESIFDAMINPQPMNNSNYPPHDIIQVDDNSYTISLAVAGHKPESIKIEATANGMLEVYTVGYSKTKIESDVSDNKIKYLHHGISKRDFCLKFMLEKHIKVHSAEHENGILSIKLIRELPKDYVNYIEITKK